MTAPSAPRSLFSLILLCSVWLVACDTAPEATPSVESTASVAALVADAKAGGEDGPLRWSEVSAEALWAHVAALDSTFLVGLKQPGQARGVDERGRSLVPEHLWESLGRQLEQHGAELLYVDDFHPLVKVRLSGPGQVRALRRSPFVEYVEPARFDASVFGMASKCSPISPTLTGGTISPGDRLPYTLARHKVPLAWQLATGAGVLMGVVDTGASVYQPQLQTWRASWRRRATGATSWARRTGRASTPSAHLTTPPRWQVNGWRSARASGGPRTTRRPVRPS